jgi:hypothetical protein
MTSLVAVAAFVWGSKEQVSKRLTQSWSCFAFAGAEVEVGVVVVLIRGSEAPVSFWPS